MNFTAHNDLLGLGVPESVSSVCTWSHVECFLGVGVKLVGVFPLDECLGLAPENMKMFDGGFGVVPELVWRRVGS
jgi:hypothetical protein